MRYGSTRGGGGKKSFDEIVYAGLASDGGLYEPLSWPSKRKLRRLLSRDAPLAAIVGEVLRLFAAPKFADIDFTEIAHKAYKNFNSSAVTPLREVERNLWLLELFHGPTLSFKDLPLQVYGRLLERVAAKRKRLLIMIGATSGDTGSAAIAALKPIRGLRLFMLHPRGRISDLQRKQMTSNQAPHICNIAVDGSYDDCLRLVKAMFASEEIRARGELGSVNSFNWVRIAVQAAVYLHAAHRLPNKGKKLRFALASGNFGNAYAGYVAHRLGAPIESIELAVSKNDCLHSFFETGSVKVAAVVPSLTPSIDIMTPNNLERLIYRILGSSARSWRKLLAKSSADKAVAISRSSMRKDIFKFFHSSRFDDEQTLEAIVQAYQSLGEPIDPHSAIALAVAQRARRRDASSNRDKDVATIAFATASPAKFPETIERAIGARPHIPLRLAELNEQQEVCENIPAEEAKLEELIIKRLRSPLDSDEILAAVDKTETSASGAATTTSVVQGMGVAAGMGAAAGTDIGSTDAVEKKEEVLAEEEAMGARTIEASPTETSLAETSSTETSPAEESPIEASPIEASPTETSPAEESPIEEAPAPTPATLDADLTTEFPPTPAPTPAPTPGPALSAVTASEESLERKIAKLKEQTTRLDQTLGTSSLDTSGIDTSALGSASEPVIAMPSVLRATTAASPQELGQESGQESIQDPTIAAPGSLEDANSSLGERVTASFSATTDKDEVVDTPPDFRAAGSIEEPSVEEFTEGSTNDDIENLAQAAEEGQASLESKIAKLKEQSALLDDAAEQTKRSLEQDSLAAFPSSGLSTSSVAGFPSAEREEQPAEPIIAGASPFFGKSTTSTATSDQTSNQTSRAALADGKEEEQDLAATSEREDSLEEEKP